MVRPIPRLAASLIATLFCLAPALAGADELLESKLSQSGNRGEPPVIYLGSIAVGGEKEIYEALQDIKVALEQPLSNDPRLADVVVCRLSDDIGTRTKQLLVCATNRVLNQNKELLQAVMSTSLNNTNQSPSGDIHNGTSTGCAGACYGSTFSILNETLNDTRRHYLKQQVNGASLHAILTAIPYPKQAVPAAATVVAPAAITAHV